jgi:hypothetical protein
MNARQQRGLQIFRNGGISQTPKGWIVPSQSGHGSYLVYKEGMRTKCSCPDCELRGIKCKHQFAVDYFLKIEKVTDEDGNITITKTVRKTYKQDWRNYTKAQNVELKMFDWLLSELVKLVPEPQQFRGRPRLSLRDQLYCSIMKVYSQLSSRRARSLYMTSKDKEYIGKAPNYNAINYLLNREDITPMLQRFLVISALPLKDIETTFITVIPLVY